MSVSQNINIAYSFDQPLSNIFPSPIISLRAPLATDKAQLGTLWVEKTTNSAWILTSIVANSATWVDVSGGSGSFATLTVGSNFSVQPTVINMATNAVAQTVTIGNVTGATAVNVNTGTGGMAVTTTNGAFSIATGTGAINIGTDAVAKTITIGDITGGTAVDINTGTGGLSVTSTGVGPIILTSTQAVELVGPVSLIADGVVSMQPITVTAASPTASVTSNNRVITATFTGFTTATSASQAFSIVSSDILATSGIFVTVSNLNASTNGAIMSLVGVTQAGGSILVHTTNNGAGALGSGDNVLINVWVIS